MLSRSELNTLTQWCHSHAIRWMPAVAECGRPAMILEWHEQRRNWKRLFLILDDDGFSLVTEKGETIASASELPAVLDTISSDAMSGGVMTPQQTAAPRRPADRRLAEASASFVF